MPRDDLILRGKVTFYEFYEYGFFKIYLTFFRTPLFQKVKTQNLPEAYLFELFDYPLT